MTVLSDVELLNRARADDPTALTELYLRHRSAARRLAATTSRGGDPDDLVNEAFERVFSAVRRDTGPTEAFRAYLFVTIRRLAARNALRNRTDPYDEVPEPVAATATSPDLDPSEREMVTNAFSTLPERWQAVLWHTAIEGRQPREVAGALGMSANAVAALAYRAREKLRQAYLQAHLQAAPHPACEPYRSTLGAYVRNGLGKREHAATRKHVEGCVACRTLVSELDDVNHMLARSVLPMFLVGTIGEAAATGTSAASLAASTASAGAMATSPDAAGVAEVALTGGRRTLGILPETTSATQVAGGVAASLVVLVALGTTGSALLLDEDPPDPPAPAVAVHDPQDTTTTKPSDSDVPRAERSLVPCRSGVAAQAAEAEPAGAHDDTLLSEVPIGLVLTLDLSTPPANREDDGDGGSRSLNFDSMACETTPDDGDIVVTVEPSPDDPEPPSPAPDPGISIETGDLVPNVATSVLPEVDASLSVALDDGARVALETNLNELCTQDSEKGNLVCTLDGVLGGTVTDLLANAGLGLEVEGLSGDVLLVEFKDGDLILETRLLNLVP